MVARSQSVTKGRCRPDCERDLVWECLGSANERVIVTGCSDAVDVRCYSSFSSSFRPTFLPYSLSTYLER